VQNLSFDDYKELSYTQLMQIHLNFIELVDDDALWRRSGFASFAGSHIRLSALNRVVPNMLLNWNDRMFAMNDVVWRNLQRADPNGVLQRISFDEFVQFVSE
jgi:hypothetical protein